jgi:hypothetical protein
VERRTAEEELGLITTFTHTTQTTTGFHGRPDWTESDEEIRVSKEVNGVTGVGIAGRRWGCCGFR